MIPTVSNTASTDICFGSEAHGLNRRHRNVGCPRSLGLDFPDVDGIIDAEETLCAAVKE